MATPTLEDLRRLRNEIKATRGMIWSDPVNGGRADDCPYSLAQSAFTQAARAYVVALLDAPAPSLSAGESGL